MKTITNRNRLSLYKPQPPICPNAADNHYFAQKALDVITAIVSCVGFTTAMLFLMTLA